MNQDLPSLFELLLEDYITYDRDFSRPGFQALAVYRFGVARMRVKPLLLSARKY